MTPRALDELVDAATEWRPVDWWKLEIRSLDAAPLVQGDFVVLAPPEAVKSQYTKFSAAGCLQGLSYLFLLVGPLIGTILMVRWSMDGGGSGMPLVPAGVLTAIALAITVYSEIQAHLHPSSTTVRTVVSFVVLQVVPGLVTVFIALTASPEERVEGAVGWLLVIGVEMVLHVVIALRARIMPRGSSVGILEDIRSGVAELDSRAVHDLLARRADALHKLEERGLIDAATCERADAAPLGEMSWTIAPELAQQYRPDAAKQ